jgi:hypothetical protein
MASLFGILLDTMPLAGAQLALMANYGKDFEDLSDDEAGTLLRYLLPDEDYTAQIPELKATAKLSEEDQVQRLWGWKHVAAEPAKITDVYCRHRGSAYKPHKVLDWIQWGLEDPAGKFRQVVRITNACGVPIELPLTQEFVYWKWLAHAGWLPEDATPLWRLPALHDSSLVIAFAYEIDPTTGTARSLRTSTPRKATEAAAREDMETNARRLAKGSAKTDDPEAIDRMICEAQQQDPLRDGFVEPCDGVTPWGGQILRHHFMNRGPSEGAVQGQTGDKCPATAAAARVLVVLSLTTCRERANYEPGGVVGVARFYPHVTVHADIPLTKIEASILFDRPPSTTIAAEGSGGPEEEECCKGHDASEKWIDAVLVADANKNNQSIPAAVMPMLPVWANMFAYCLPGAYAKVCGQRIRCVRPELKGPRVNDEGIVFRHQVLGDIVTAVEKEPYQGEFDNIHISPPMKLVNVAKMAFPNLLTYTFALPGLRADFLGTTFPVDRKAMKLDEITMAPLCAHDCFHMHWRWGKTAEAKWVLGWDETGPYRVAGAPLVPRNQGVEIWLRSQSAFTYHATVQPADGESLIPANVPQIIMHHGGGYAVAMEKLKKLLMDFTFDIVASPPIFLTDDNSRVSALDSWAMLYWWNRYTASLSDDGNSYAISERIQYIPGGLDAARYL